jgi:methionyl-tRNA synthetase
MTKNNSELLNNLGNFVNRALKFVFMNFAAKIPRIDLEDDDKRVIATINKEIQSYIKLLDKGRLREGLRQLLNISKLGNQYIQAHKPWELIKKDDDSKIRAGTILGLAANIAALLSLLLSPYLPATCETLRQQLNFKTTTFTGHFFRLLLPPGHVINEPTPLFRKIEQKEVDSLKERFAGKQAKEVPATGADSNQTKAHTNSSNGSNTAATVSGDEQELLKLITEQGDKVRELKTAKAEKSDVENAVKTLLSLKQQYTQVTGKSLDPPKAGKKKAK